MIQYLAAIEPELVGKYRVLVRSGVGYFFDDVLECSVWCHPERGAPDVFDGEDYDYVFETHEQAFFLRPQVVLLNLWFDQAV